MLSENTSTNVWSLSANDMLDDDDAELIDDDELLDESDLNRLGTGHKGETTNAFLLITM